jgi:hypothetical protein
VAEEVARHTPRRLLVQLDEGELGRAVDGHEEVQLALLGPTSAMSMWKKPIGSA